MRRSDREQSLEFALELIDRCQHGTVAFATEDGAPYCIPLSLVRVGDKLYFHCAKEGHKTDLLRHDSRVCITFVGADEPAFVAPAMYTTYFQSAVVIGRASEVTEPEEKAEALRALCRKLTPTTWGRAWKRPLKRACPSPPCGVSPWTRSPERPS